MLRARPLEHRREAPWKITLLPVLKPAALSLVPIREHRRVTAPRFSLYFLSDCFSTSFEPSALLRRLAS